MSNIPLWVRKFIVDFVETFVPALLVINFLGGVDDLLPAIGVAAAAAGLSALRRNLPEAYAWFRGLLGVPTTALAVVVAILVVSAPAAAGWRQPPETKWPDLNAELVPVNTELTNQIDLMVLAVGEVNAAVSDIYLASGTMDVARIRVAQEALTTATDAVMESAELIQLWAGIGLDTLDKYPTEPCSYDYVAVVRVGYLLLGDSAESILISSTVTLGTEWQTAMWLFKVQAELEYSQVTCE